MPAKTNLKDKVAKPRTSSAKLSHHSNGDNRNSSSSTPTSQAQSTTNEHLAKANKSMMRAWDLISQRRHEG